MGSDLDLELQQEHRPGWQYRRGLRAPGAGHGGLSFNIALASRMIEG